MKVLVTGAGGFIGSRLCHKLKLGGYEVHELKHSDGDIRDLRCFDKFNDIKPDKIIHLAGKSYVPDSWDFPSEFIDINFNGTRNALQKCRDWGSEIIFLSSYIYGVPNKLPIEEDHKLDPFNPYAYSKSISENICKYFSEQFEIPCRIIRPFNIYGPQQVGSFLIPTVIDQLKNDDQDEIVLKTLKPKRDFLYIDDLIELITLMLKTTPSNKFEILNAGSGLSYSVKEIVDILLEISSSNKKVVDLGETRKSEVFEIIADIGLAKKLYDFKIKTDIRTGLKHCYFESE